MSRADFISGQRRDHETVGDSQQRLGLEAAIGESDFDPAEFKMINGQNEEKQYDVIVVGAGSAGSVLAAEVSASGA